MTRATDMPKWRLVMALAALFLSSMCTMGDLVITPVAADVYDAFSDSPVALVNLGVTGPALVGLPFGVFTGILCDRMDKKLIMVAGFSIFTASAVFGIAQFNVYYFMVMRLLATGVGWGITNTAALSILADMFTDDGEHARYVGWYNAVMSVMGALLAYSAGVLALGGWTHAYSAYLIAIPVLVMLAIFLPSFPPTEEHHAVDNTPLSQAGCKVGAESRKGWKGHVAILTIQVFLIASLYFVILYLISLYVADVNAGDESFSGTLTSILTIATAVGSLVFGSAYKRLHNAVYLPAITIIGCVFLVLAFVPEATVIMVCMAVAGFMWPFYFCFFYTHVTEIAPPGKQGTATSIVAAADGLASTACSYLLTGSLALTGGTCVTVFPAFGIALIIIAAVSTVYWFYKRQQLRSVFQ